MERDNIYDFTADPRDDEEFEDEVGLNTSSGGGEGNSNPVVELDDVLFDGEELNPIELDESKKRKVPPKGKTPKKLKETHEPSKKKRALCWDHFEPFTKDNVRWARCNYCGKEYAADSKKHGVTNLNSHTPNCRMYPNRDKDGQPNLTFKRKGDGVELVPSMFSQAESKKALAEMIIIDELPFRFVEGIGFRRYCAVVQPKIENVSRQTIAREVSEINKSEKLKLKKGLKGRRICLTTDTWTSIQNLNYMCLTAHFVDDDWKLQKKILNFCQVEDHKGMTIGKKIESLLLEWKVDGIFTVTVDNASSNNTALKYLERTTKEWSRTILEHRHLHMRCCSHILNLIVVEGLKEQFEPISRVRDVVRYVRSSPQRMESFKKYVEAAKIVSKQRVCLDVCTRWNSTYIMLEVAIKFEKAFERMAMDDSNFIKFFDIKEGDLEEDTCEEDSFLDFSISMVDLEGSEGRKPRPPTKKDWKICGMFVNFLKLFYDATKRFSGSLFVTSNSFLESMIRIEMQIGKLVGNDDPLLSQMAKKMKEKFEKYWDFSNINLLLYVSATLDPRFKLNLMMLWFEKSKGKEEAERIEEKVKELLHKLYNAYANEGERGRVEPTIAMPKATIEVEDDGDDFDKLTMELDTYVEEKHSSTCSSEVDKYLGDLPHRREDEKFEILEWWKANCNRYPILSQVARDVLAMPISTVASESAFSTGGRVLDPFRSSLSPTMVETLVCTQNWLLSTVPISIRQSLDKVEEFEKEMLSSDSSFQSSDLTTED